MTTKHTRGVLDLTFMDVDSEEKLSEQIRAEKIVQIRPPSPRRSPAKTDNEHANNSSMPVKTEAIKAIRLSNNQLKNMNMLVGPMTANIDTREIQWLDLSFNHIISLGNSENIAAAFPNVTTIYLHANKISRLSQLKKLKAFPNLKSLSLYGNPIEEHKHYRNYVMHYCPNLTQFDSSPITSSERVTNKIWSQTFRNALSKGEEV